MIGIFQVERRNTGYIGRYAHMIIRDTYSRPDTTNLIRPFSKDFEVPYFVRIGNGKTFAPVAITIFLDQVAHQTDGFACGSTTLQGNLGQFFDHEHTFLVDQLFPAGDRCFSNT